LIGSEFGLLGERSAMCMNTDVVVQSTLKGARASHTNPGGRID
jgi:hypothetical protein